MRFQPIKLNLPTARFWVLAAGLASTLALPLASHADPTATPERTATPGIVAEKPAEGPFVELEDGTFMVPYTQRIPGTDIEFVMVPVPGGEFTLGSPDDAEGHVDDEGPTIPLKVKPMWVAKTETRWDMYKEFMRMYGVFKDFEARGVRKVDESNLADSVTAPTPLYEPTFTHEYGERDNQPAVTMTQYAAQQFSKWLSRMSGIQYRLPTEAEWEYAARGGTTTAYSWGDDPDEIDDYAWYYDNAPDGPGDVATKKPNPFGLYDMHGNAAELTVNEYTEDGYQWMAEKKPADATSATRWPQKPDPCAIRGGSWQMDPPELRSAARLASDDEEWKDADPNFPRSPWWFTDDPSRGVGFRLFRSLEVLPKKTIAEFWDTAAEDTHADVESRVSEGRGGYGYVDEGLGDAAKSDGK